MAKAIFKKSEIDKLVKKALDHIRRGHKADGRSLEAHFKSIFDHGIWQHSTWAKILAGKPLALRDKLAIIAAYRFTSADLLFAEIFKKAGFENPEEIDGIYDGFFRYWRYYLDRHLNKEVLRWGIIRIKTSVRNHSDFSHWSYDRFEASKETTISDLIHNPGAPEDEGIALHTEHKIFMLGFRKHNIRLAIADCPRGDLNHDTRAVLKDKYINGIVLTNRLDTNIYSAAFVMFHQSHPKFNDIISSEEFKTMQAAHASEEHLTLGHL